MARPSRPTARRRAVEYRSHSELYPLQRPSRRSSTRTSAGRPIAASRAARAAASAAASVRAHALLHDGGRQVRQLRCRRPRPRRVRKHVHAAEEAALQRLQRARECSLVLGGIADDHVGAEHSSPRRRPQALDRVEIPGERGRGASSPAAPRRPPTAAARAGVAPLGGARAVRGEPSSRGSARPRTGARASARRARRPPRPARAGAASPSHHAPRSIPLSTTSPQPRAIPTRAAANASSERHAAGLSAHEPHDAVGTGARAAVLDLQHEPRARAGRGPRRSPPRRPRRGRPCPGLERQVSRAEWRRGWRHGGVMVAMPWRRGWRHAGVAVASGWCHRGADEATPSPPATRPPRALLP